MEKNHSTLGVKVATAGTLVVGALLTVMAGMASATAPSVGDTTTDAISDWSDQALEMWPAALGAGLALWGVTILVRFGKRVFGAAK